MTTTLQVPFSDLDNQFDKTEPIILTENGILDTIYVTNNLDKKVTVNIETRATKTGNWVTLNNSKILDINESKIWQTNIDAHSVRFSIAKETIPTKGTILFEIFEENTQVSVSNKASRYAISGDSSVFGQVISSPKVSQIDVQFHETATPDDLLKTVTKTNGITTTQTTGMGVFSTGTGVNEEYLSETFETISAQSGGEVYAYFTGRWPTAPTNSDDFATLGMFNTGNNVIKNGYEIGYKGPNFGVRYVRNGSEVSFTTKENFSQDLLDGGSGTSYTLNGDAVEINLQKMQAFRIRFGGVSSAPTHFEVLAPDGHWVRFHSIKHPNTLEVAQTTTPDMSIGIHLEKVSSDSTDIKIETEAWGGGIVINALVGQQPDGDYVANPADGETFREIDTDGLAAEGPETDFTVDDTTNVFTSSSHGLAQDDAVALTTTDTLPSPLETNEIYFISDVTTDTFKLKRGVGAPTIDITDTGTGTHSFKTRDFFVSNFQDSDQWKSIEIGIETGKTGTLFIEFTDNVQTNNPKNRLPSIRRELTQDLVEEGGAAFKSPVRLDGYRVRFVNGPEQSNFFHIWSTLRNANTESPQAPISSGIRESTNAIMSRSILTGRNEKTGIYENVGLSPNNALHVGVTERQSEVRKRIHVDANISAAEASKTIHTVTNGHTFYLTSIMITSLNSSTNTSGVINLRDGGGSGIIKMPFSIARGTSSQSGQLNLAITLPEPLQFDTDVFYEQLSGTLNTSIVLIGYEEPN